MKVADFTPSLPTESPNIQDSSESSQWRYIPTDLNPADDCTRGLHASEITRNCHWILGTLVSMANRRQMAKGNRAKVSSRR